MQLKDSRFTQIGLYIKANFGINLSDKIKVFNRCIYSFER